MRLLTTVSAPRAWRNLSPDFVGDVFGEFDRMVDTVLQPTFARNVNFQPSCEINETENHFLLSFDMPGVKKSDIKIEVRENQIFISGERRREATSDKFERTFTLPTSVDTEKIEANYEDGVLHVALPKAEAAKPRTIEIQSEPKGFLAKLLSGENHKTNDSKNVNIS